LFSVIQPDRAESVMQVEVLIIPGRRDFLVDIVLAEYLPVRVDVFFHNIHIISRIQLHQYYRQLACNVKDPKGVNYVFAFGGGAFGRGFLIDTVAERVVLDLDGILRVFVPLGLAQLIITVEGIWSIDDKKI
jgi:hypothetical protein